MMDVYQNNVTGHVVSVDPTGRPWPMGGVWLLAADKWRAGGCIAIELDGEDDDDPDEDDAGAWVEWFEDWGET